MALGDIAPELRGSSEGGLAAASREGFASDQARAIEMIDGVAADITRQIEMNVPAELRTALLQELSQSVGSAKLSISGVNGATAISRALEAIGAIKQTIGSQIEVARAVATSNAIYNSLSAAGQAAVNARVDALSEGRFADYYLSKTSDSHQGYSDAALENISQQIANDPVFQSRMLVAQAAPHKILRAAEAELEANREYIEARLSSAQTPEERQLWQQLLEMPKSQRPQFRTELENVNSIEALRAITSHIENTEIQNMAERFSDSGIDPQCRQGLRTFYASADGFGVDYERLFRDMNAPENQSKMAQARDAYARAHNDLSQVPAELRQFVVLSLAKEYRMADAHSQNSVFGVMRQTYLDTTHQSEEHRMHWNQIMDKGLPVAQRVSMLEEELIEHRFGNPSSPNYRREIQQIAANAIATLQLSDDPRAEITGRSTAGITRMSIQSKVIANITASGLSVTEAQDYVRERNSIGALLPFAASLDSEEARLALRNEVNQSLAINTNEALRPALSRIRYYNLNDSADGRTLSNRIIYGQLDAVEAEAQAVQLQQAVVARMINYQSVVNHSIPADEHTNHSTTADERIEPTDYHARLTALGMYNADGSLNVDRIIETARTNRDLLDARNLAAAREANGTMSDTQLSTVTNRAYAGLPEELKDARVIARTAARFKAIEAIQTYGREIGEALARIEENVAQASPELLAEQQNYRNMTNADGTVAPEVQRAAIQSFLNQQQYFRTTPDLREIITQNLIVLSQHNPEILLGHEFTNNQRIVLGPEAPQPVNLSSAEVQSLRNEGKNASRLFGTKIESNIRQALEGQEMADVVRVFGSYMTSADGTQFNGGNIDNISVYELQNALMGTNEATKGSDRDRVFAETDTDRDGKLSVEELVERLRTNGQLATNVAGGQSASNTTPPPAPMPNAQPNTGQTSPTPTSVR